MAPKSFAVPFNALKARPSSTMQIRSALQRRYASNHEPKLVGPMDNAFNRERLAVKEHAGKSAGIQAT